MWLSNSGGSCSSPVHSAHSRSGESWSRWADSDISDPAGHHHRSPCQQLRRPAVAASGIDSCIPVDGYAD
ncbi:hypothetical protein TRIUR3_10999 [Triticum urartu]|uniref:Uncharacterized protein n=1 Tax=Triticum urartu TaxID=4572 RepID=M8A0G4_TRIUA|nr:hypothetical protein TRIUR3_10999 [Triticum urartu]